MEKMFLKVTSVQGKVTSEELWYSVTRSGGGNSPGKFSSYLSRDIQTSVWTYKPRLMKHV